jgi:hypothetical protein
LSGAASPNLGDDSCWHNYLAALAASGLHDDQGWAVSLVDCDERSGVEDKRHWRSA